MKAAFMDQGLGNDDKTGVNSSMTQDEFLGF